jgi:hypothetical protein
VIDKQLAACFNRVRIGSSEGEVLRTLGKPNRIEKCGEFFGPLDKAELGDCSKEYFYASPFAPVLPQYYVMRFAGSDLVSSATPYSSS